MRILIEHSDKTDLIEEICKSIDRAPSRWIRHLVDGRLLEEKNQAYRKNPHGDIDRRFSFNPEIKSAGYILRDDEIVELFHSKKQGKVLLEKGYIGERCTIATVEGTDAKMRATLTEWFLGRIIYHFSKTIHRIEVRDIIAT